MFCCSYEGESCSDVRELHSKSRNTAVPALQTGYTPLLQPIAHQLMSVSNIPLETTLTLTPYFIC